MLRRPQISPLSHVFLEIHLLWKLQEALTVYFQCACPKGDLSAGSQQEEMTNKTSAFRSTHDSDGADQLFGYCFINQGLFATDITIKSFQRCHWKVSICVRWGTWPACRAASPPRTAYWGFSVLQKKPLLLPNCYRNWQERSISRCWLTTEEQFVWRASKELPKETQKPWGTLFSFSSACDENALTSPLLNSFPK